MYQPGRLAGEGHEVVATIGPDLRDQARTDLCRIHGRWVGFEPIDERCAECPRRRRLAGRELQGERRHHELAVPHLDHVRRVGGQDPVLPLRIDRHLGAGEEPGADHHPLRAQREGCRQAAAVADAARGEDGHVTGQVDHLRHEDHGRDPPGIAAGLPALCGEHVRTRLQGERGAPHVSHLLDPSRTHVMGFRDPLGGHPHVEGDRCWSRLENRGEHLRVEGAPGVVDRERPVGQLAQARPLGAQLLRRAHGRTDAPEPSCVADGSGQLDLLPGSERCEDDRKLHAEQVTEPHAHLVVRMPRRSGFPTSAVSDGAPVRD